MMIKNPYIWILLYEYKTPEGGWANALECYESLWDAEDALSVLKKLTSNYRNASLTNRDVKTREYVKAIKEAAVAL